MCFHSDFWKIMREFVKASDDAKKENARKKMIRLWQDAKDEEIEIFARKEAARRLGRNGTKEEFLEIAKKAKRKCSEASC